MQATIKVFASLRQLAGGEEISVELGEDATVADALAQLSWVDEDTAMVVAVNREYADRSTRLHPGDEIALIPPVSGGAAAIHVQIRLGALSPDDVTALVTDPRAGAVVTFLGVTREVPALEYEAYVEMAVREVTQIARDAAQRHGLCAVAVEHRVGTVSLSETSVVIAVSAPHRAEAFAGAREVIDEIKLRAPIWKREEGEWVAGHLPASNR